MARDELAQQTPLVGLSLALINSLDRPGPHCAIKRVWPFCFVTPERKVSMSQAELERELARHTGESVRTLRRRGFQYVEVPDLKPLVVDWDELDEGRTSYVPQRSRAHRAA